MPFSFPVSPSIGQQSTQNGRVYQWTGSAWDLVAAANNHTHISSSITDFNSSVSGLLPVKNIVGSGYAVVSSSLGNYSVSVTGLQPSGNYALSSHTHTASEITNFNSSVSGLVSGIYYLNSNPSGYTNNTGTVTSVAALTLGSTGTDVSSSVSNASTTPVIALNIPSSSASNRGLLTSSDWSTFNNKQPSGNYSTVGHTHTSSNITDFNSSVSGLLPVTNITAGTNISISSSSGNFTINSTAAGGGATISNSGLNRLLTSDGSTSGIVGQANITFNGSLLNVNGSGNFASGVFVSGVPIGEVIDDEVAGLLVAGSGINLTYNDSANTLTVDTNVSTSLIAGTGISLAYNSSTDELSIQANTNVINSSNLYLWSNFR